MANRDLDLNSGKIAIEISGLEKSTTDILSVLEKCKHIDWLKNLEYYYALAEKYLKEIDNAVKQIIDGPDAKSPDSNIMSTFDHSSIIETKVIIELLHKYSLGKWSADQVYLKTLAHEYIKRRKIKI